jgi:uncharacterized glyoxalase superfamily protein PhnB
MLSPILSVNDIARSIEFYVDTLRFERNWSMDDDDGNPTFACVKLGDAEILLGTIDFVAPEDREKLGVGVQIYVEIPANLDIDAIYATAQSKNANITRPIEDREWGERAFAVKDLDGYHLLIAQQIKKQNGV